MLGIPATQGRVSRNPDTMEPESVKRQDGQIVQSWLTLRGFLP